MPEVHYLLVLATPVEVSLVGLYLKPDGTIASPLIDLPLYRCSTDGVCMTHIAATRGGRIFCAGSDGGLYEVAYAAEDGWGQRRCRKICHHAALSRWLPSVLRFTTDDALKQAGPARLAPPPLSFASGAVADALRLQTEQAQR